MPLTVKRAKDALERPLVFGDEEQVRAVAFLSEVERFKSLVENGEIHLVTCQECNGHGDSQCHECMSVVECRACGGKGKVLDGRNFGFRWDVAEAATDEMVEL